MARARDGESRPALNAGSAAATATSSRPTTTATRSGRTERVVSGGSPIAQPLLQQSSHALGLCDEGAQGCTYDGPHKRRHKHLEGEDGYHLARCAAEGLEHAYLPIGGQHDAADHVDDDGDAGSEREDT